MANAPGDFSCVIQRFVPYTFRLSPLQNEMVAVLESSLALDREQLRDITMGDEELMREVLSALWDDTAAQIVKLDAAVRAGDAEQCMRLAHYSKGACANVGANAAAATFLQIESGARARQLEKCAEPLAALASVLQELRGEIRSFGV